MEPTPKVPPPEGSVLNDEEGDPYGEDEDLPPDYYQVVMEDGQIKLSDVPGAPQYEEPKLQGIPGIAGENEAVHPSEAPPPYPGENVPAVVYADFLPRLLKAGTDISIPKYDNFRSLMTYVNWWLQGNPQYVVIRCESIERKLLDKSGVVETETTVHHVGIWTHTMYLVGLRLWLGHRLADNNEPAQQLGYVNVMPKANMKKVQVYHGMRGHTMWTQGMTAYQAEYPVYEDLGKTIERFNEKLKEHPLPGKVLTIESLDLKHKNTWTQRCLDPDSVFWQEKKASIASKLYLSFFRIFFLQGLPAHETIDIVDIVPEITRLPPPGGYPQFEPYQNLINKTNQWITAYDKQQVRVTNIQTIPVKVEDNRWTGLLAGPLFIPAFRTEMSNDDQYGINTLKSDFTEGSTTQQVKTIRIAFTRGPDLEALTLGLPPIHLTSKLFVPVRLGAKTAETTSQTVQRVNAWLGLTGARVIGAETVKFEFNPSLKRLNSEKVSAVQMSTRSYYFMTALRLYFDGTFQEPAAHLLPPADDYGARPDNSQCCNIV